VPLVVPYDPEWALRFEVESAMLERVLARWLGGGIHHVGSTAVPGLAAKPVIDIMVGVRDLEEARAASEPLGVLDYAWHTHRPGADAFFKPPTADASEHTHRLYLTEPGSAIWCERLAFRGRAPRQPRSRRGVRRLEGAARGGNRRERPVHGRQARIRASAARETDSLETGANS